MFAMAITFVVAVRVLSARSVVPTFLMPDVSIREPDTGSTPVVLTASMAPPILIHGDITMSFSTVAGTATEGTACGVGVDFIGARNQKVTVSSQQSSVRISIQVCGDIRFEPNETFTVKLLDSAGETKIAEGHVTILENDPAPMPWTGLTAEGAIAKAEEQRWQTPDLPAGNYVFTLYNRSGDSDLYVRIGAEPTVTTYSCRPAKSGADETCSVNLNVPDVIHVMVRGYAPSSTFRLTGSAK